MRQHGDGILRLSRGQLETANERERPPAMEDTPQKPDAPTVPPHGPGVNARGWFRAMRTAEALELIRANPLAYVLAAVIAFRGRYKTGFNADNLQLGEALLGDFQNYGMSEREYRTAKEQLAKWHFATFQATNKGSIGRLTDTRLFSIFRLAADDQNDNRPACSRRLNDDQATTNKISKTEEDRKEIGKKPSKSKIVVWNR